MYIFNIKMKFIVMALMFAVLFLITVFISNTHVPVYAHISETFGNFTVDVGWSNEPPLLGEINNAIVQVNKGTENSYTPVRNALAGMYILVKYGGVTKTLDFEPSEQSAGLYEAKMIPTRLGSYSLVLNGTIQEQSIVNSLVSNGTIQEQSIVNAAISLDDVEGKHKLSVPDS